MRNPHLNLPHLDSILSLMSAVIYPKTHSGELRFVVAVEVACAPLMGLYLHELADEKDSMRG